MNYPKINTAKAISNHILLVEFDNSAKKVYDVTPLFEREMFSLLKNPAFFRNVQVENGGYAVFWNEDIDISEYELWIHGKLIEN